MICLAGKKSFSNAARGPAVFTWGFFLGLGFLLLTACTEQDKDPKREETSTHAGEAKQGGHAEEGVVELKPETLAAQGIVVEALVPKPMTETLRLSGEIAFNENRRVTPGMTIRAKTSHLADS